MKQTIKERICQHCLEALLLSSSQFSNHVKYCDRRNQEEVKKSKENAKNGEKIYFDLKLGEFKDFQVTCSHPKCQKEFFVNEREKQFPLKEKYFCSKSCASSFSTLNDNKKETKQVNCIDCQKQIQVNKHSNPKTSLCEECRKERDRLSYERAYQKEKENRIPKIREQKASKREIIISICLVCNKKIEDYYPRKYHNECRKSTKENLENKVFYSKEKENLRLKEVIGKRGSASTIEGELERRKKISISMKKNPKSGGLREGSGRGVKQWYLSHIAGEVYLRSTYELNYVLYLDREDIKWKGNKEGFKYSHEGIESKYYPDFYLIESNIFVEIKGFKTKRDESKWRDFPHKLVILMKEDIDKLK